MIDETRRDIRLGDISALDPSATAAAGPQVSSTAGVVTTRQPAVTAEVPPGSAARGRPASPRLPVPVIVLVVAVLLLAAAVVHLLLEQRRLQASLAVLEAQSRESVASLADRMASTSTNLKSADSETLKSLNLLASDIAKLDAAAARLSKALEQQGRQHTAVAGELRALGAEVQRSDQAAAQADAQRDGRARTLTEALDALAVRQKSLADTVARLERSSDATQLRAEVAVLGTSLRELQEQYDRRLKAGEQAVASNDAFRRQVNATIDRLNQQINELYQRR